MTLPSALQDLATADCWVGWKWVTLANGKRDKPPFRADFPEFNASTQNPRTWGSFRTACTTWEAGKVDGIGYVLRDDPRHVFIDLDKCRNPETGEIADWAMRIVEEANSYTEITPSARGLRIIGYGGHLGRQVHTAYKLPGGGTGEIFFRAPRYVTVTGNRMDGTPNNLADISDIVTEVLMTSGKATTANTAAEPFASSPEAAASIDDIRAALAVIPNAGDDVPYDDWVRLGLAVYAASGGSPEGRDAWEAWSGKSSKYVAQECERVWQSFRRAPPKRIGYGSLHYQATSNDPFFVPPSWRAKADPFEEPAATGGIEPPKAEPRKPLWIDSEGWDDTAIPKRPWCVPGYLMRGAVSVLSGQGAGGKSSLTVAWTVALAFGEPMGEFRPAGKLKMVNYNVEDDRDEQRRRYSAALSKRKLKPADLAGRVVRCGPHDVGTLFERHPDTGRIVPTAAMQTLERLCMETEADVLVCDPLAELHNAEENDNTAMRSVIAAFRSMAQRLGIAILILHHDRKGNNTPGDMDRVRGASAISGAVRVMMTLSTMTPDEAGSFGVPLEERRRHFRIDGAKSNYAPATDAEWWKLEPVTIGNGEDVAAAFPWEPPSPFEGLSMPACVAILDRLAAGIPGQDRGFAADSRAKTEWAGVTLTVGPHSRTDKQAASILGQWEANGLIERTLGDSPRRGHKRENFAVNQAEVEKMRREIKGGQPNV